MPEASSAEELFAALAERVGEAVLKAFGDQTRPFHMLDDRQKATVFALGGVPAIVAALIAAEFEPSAAVAMVTTFAAGAAEDIANG